MGNGIGRKIGGVACVVGGLLALVGPGAALAQVKGGLDPSFGKGGEVVVRASGPAATERIGRLPGARIGLFDGFSLYDFSPRGRKSGGPVSLPAAKDARRLAPYLASDRAGNLLVAGSQTPLPFTEAPNLHDPSLGIVGRFGGGGRLDRSFGGEGLLQTDFGLKPPTASDRTYFGSAPSLPPGSALGPAQAQITGIAVDKAGRILLTGTRLADQVACGHLGSSAGPSYEAFVARLNPGGSLDTSFGTKGVVGFRAETTGAPYNSIAQPVPDPQDGVYVRLAQPGFGCPEADGDTVHVAHLDVNGALDKSWGGNGVLALGGVFGAGTTIAAGPGGGLLVQAGLNQGIEKLRADGRPDPNFGELGLAVPFPEQRGRYDELSIAEIQTDARGHIWLAGTKSSYRLIGGDARHLSRSGFLVARLKADGSLDPGFGEGGQAVAWFGKKGFAQAQDLLISAAGAPLVAGALHSPTLGHHEAMAIARFRAGR